MKQRITLQLRQVLIQEMEPDIIEKIRVRQIEIVDDNEKVVMLIGAKNGKYDSSDSTFITIFNDLGHEVIKLGTDLIGGILEISGLTGSIILDISKIGANIGLINNGIKSDSAITIQPPNSNTIKNSNSKKFDMPFGCVLISNGESLLTLDLDVHSGVVRITRVNSKVKNSKIIFD